MRLYFNLDLQKLVQNVGDNTPITSLSGKRGDRQPLDIVLIKSNSVFTAPDGTILKYGAKSPGGASYVVSQQTFSRVGIGADTIYRAYPSYNTTALNTLLGLGTGTEKASVVLDAEIEYTEPAIDFAGESVTPIESSMTIPLTIYRDIISPHELQGTPSALGLGIRRYARFDRW